MTNIEIVVERLKAWQDPYDFTDVIELLEAEQKNVNDLVVACQVGLGLTIRLAKKYESKDDWASAIKYMQASLLAESGHAYDKAD